MVMERSLSKKTLLHKSRKHRKIDNHERKFIDNYLKLLTSYNNINKFIPNHDSTSTIGESFLPHLKLSC